MKPSRGSVETMPDTPSPAPELPVSSASEMVRLVVLFGGKSAEHDVSCVSARHVIAAANREKYLIEPIGIDRDGVWHRDTKSISATSATAAGSANSAGPDHLPERLTVQGEAIDALPVLTNADMPTVVFPVLHGPMGEDGTVQGMLELADVAYVGAGVLASALCMDKVAAKAHLSAHGVTQGDYVWMTVDRRSESGSESDSDLVTFPDGTGGSIDEACHRTIGQLGLPLFVKPANMGSSVGVSRATNAAEVAAAIELAAGYDRIVIIEEEIRGREIEVAVLGNENPVASVAGEIVPGAEFYDYADKYEGGADLRIPADLTPDELEAAQTVAVGAYRALRVEGLARVDFFYEESRRDDGTGRGWLVNELNTMPGFTPISMYPKLWAESGVPYSELIDRLVVLAQERHSRKLRHRRTDR